MKTIHVHIHDALEDSERAANAAIDRIQRAANIRRLKPGDPMLLAAEQAEEEIKEVIDLCQKALQLLARVG